MLSVKTMPRQGVRLTARLRLGGPSLYLTLRPGFRLDTGMVIQPGLTQEEVSCRRSSAVVFSLFHKESGSVGSRRPSLSRADKETDRAMGFYALHLS
jgi:hypothetical protein